jgi:PST family polysaccharide transporter
MMRTGGHVTSYNLVKFLVRNADTVLVARYAGSAAAGMYDRCYRLMMLPVQNINAPLSRLLLPLLSRNLETPAVYRRQFLLAARAVTLASAPGISVATATSSALMPFLLGERWQAAGPIFFWLGLACLAQPVVNLTGVLLVTSGHTRRLMNIGVLASLETLVALTIGIHWGPVGVAAAYFLSVAVHLPVHFWWVSRGSAVSAWDLWRAQLEPLLGAAVAGLLSHVVLDSWPLVATLVVMTPLAYILSLLTSCALSSEGHAHSHELLGLARHQFVSSLTRVRLLVRQSVRRG